MLWQELEVAPAERKAHAARFIAMVVEEAARAVPEK